MAAQQNISMLQAQEKLLKDVEQKKDPLQKKDIAKKIAKLWTDKSKKRLLLYGVRSFHQIRQWKQEAARQYELPKKTTGCGSVYWQFHFRSKYHYP